LLHLHLFKDSLRNFIMNQSSKPLALECQKLHSVGYLPG